MWGLGVRVDLKDWTGGSRSLSIQHSLRYIVVKDVLGKAVFKETISSVTITESITGAVSLAIHVTHHPSHRAFRVL